MFTPYVCTNCGFWQRQIVPPSQCPVCSDVRHTLPPDGYRFLTAEQIAPTVRTRWQPIDEGVLMLTTEPAIGIGPSGYLVIRPEGNVFFDGTGYYSPDALERIAALGGIRWLAASHPHAYGALWQLQERFAPEVVIQRDDLLWTAAFQVTWPFDERLELGPGLELWHTGGHFAGHAVLYDASRRLLLAGDALKFEIEDGRAVAISCHKAFNRRIPLTHGEIRRYREVLSALPFRQVCTSFEHAPNVTRAHAVALFDALLAGRPSVEPRPLAAEMER